MSRRLLAAVTAGLKARMSIRLGAFISCCLLGYSPTVPLMLATLFLALLFGYLMILFDYKAFTEPFLFWRKLRGKVTWGDPPTFLSDLANKMNVKLNKKRPFGITDAPIGAVALVFNQKIIVSKEVLAFPEAERNAVLAHEMAHLRPNQFMKTLILLYVVMLGSSMVPIVHPVITAIGVTAFFLIARTYFSWNLEYDADRFGSRYSSKEALVSALKHLINPEECDKSSDTHPSVNNRVDRLLAPQEPFWIRLSVSLMERFTSSLFRDEFLYFFIQDLKENCQGIPKVLRPIVAIAEICKTIFLLGRHRY